MKLIFRVSLFFLITPALMAESIDARTLIKKAMEHWRGLSSYSVMQMNIRREDWQRTMKMESWTKGDKTSLVRVTEPKKDAGNGTLMLDNNMWTYTPKINRIIKIPSSMMNQNWMGSDFSNKDISKSTDIIDQYDHKLVDRSDKGGHTFYTIESIPHEDAAVVWGKEVSKIRDDYVLFDQLFYDQDGILIKRMKTLETKTFDGRAVASQIRMGKVDQPEEWTEIIVDDVRFNEKFPDYMFTLSNLRNPR